MIAATGLNLPLDFTSFTVNSAAEIDKSVWDRLLNNEVESFEYLLAFEQSATPGFRLRYIAIKNNLEIVCVLPYFITDYALDTTVQGKLKRVLAKISQFFPNLLSLKLLCVGSPVTDSCKIGLTQQYQHDSALIATLNQALNCIAETEKVSVIAFKDVIEQDSKRLDLALKACGFSQIDNMPVAVNQLAFNSLDEYLSSLSYATRKNLRRKLKSKTKLIIEEYTGLPPNIEAVYSLYLDTYEKSELQFEKLTLQFFTSIAELMPHNSRYILYYADNQLIAFNLVLHREGVLLDKYIGMHPTLATLYNVYFLSWLHNIEMCIRDGFHTYQSGQAAYETKTRLGASLQPTYIYFKHTNRWLNQPLRWLAKLLAYANFDQHTQQTKA